MDLSGGVSFCLRLSEFAVSTTMKKEEIFLCIGSSTRGLIVWGFLREFPGMIAGGDDVVEGIYRQALAGLAGNLRGR